MNAKCAVKFLKLFNLYIFDLCNILFYNNYISYVLDGKETLC